MTTAPRHPSPMTISAFTALALAATAATVIGFSSKLAEPESAIDGAVTAALQDYRGEMLEARAAAGDIDRAFLHLASLPMAEDGSPQLPSPRTMRLGDRITVGSSDGTAITYEVASVQPLPRLQGNSARRLLLVTANPVVPLSAEPLHMVVPDDRADPAKLEAAKTPRQPHAL